MLDLIWSGSNPVADLVVAGSNPDLEMHSPPPDRVTSEPHPDQIQSDSSHHHPGGGGGGGDHHLTSRSHPVLYSRLTTPARSQWTFDLTVSTVLSVEMSS